ncbi:MAG: hypothetical protein N4A49_11990 [Marinifilaceae bacterium]|nr:hypothetical protein [Marinifilaceae bacterium]
MPINKEKSGIRRPLQFSTLGYGFVSSYKKGEKGKYQLIVTKKKWDHFKHKLKEITRKTIPIDFEERIYRLKLQMRGWINYFRLANIKSKIKK